MKLSFFFASHFKQIWVFAPFYPTITQVLISCLQVLYLTDSEHDEHIFEVSLCFELV